MFETPITVVGRIVNDPLRRTAGTQDVVKFRIASNARRQLDDGNWETTDSLFVNVNCWGRLVTGVSASLKKGDIVIAVGKVHTSEYVDRDGVPRASLEMRASSVGPDLSCYIVTLQKLGRPSSPPGQSNEAEEHTDAEEPSQDPATVEADQESLSV